MGNLIGGVSDTLFGEAPGVDFQPQGFVSPGLTGAPTGDTFTLTRGPELSGALGRLSGAFTGSSGEFAGLRPITAEGINTLKKAGLDRLGAKRERSIGNLRENLARRRVLGSSFAQDAIARAEAEHGLAEERFAAEADLKAINAQMQLIDKQYGALINEAGTIINQLNLEAGMAANFAGNIQNILAQNAQLEAQLLTDFAGGRASLVGSALGYLSGGTTQAASTLGTLAGGAV